MVVKRFALSSVVLLLALLAPADRLAAQAAHDENGLLASLAFTDPRLSPQAETQPPGELRSALAAPVADAWDAFLLEAGGSWIGSVDRRTGLLELAEGSGIPWIPGAGNRLSAADVAPFTGGREVDMAAMEAIARAFLPRVAELLGVDPGELELDAGRSGHPSDFLWFVDFDLVRGGLPVEGARVVFRVNHGNLIQLGSENLPSPGATVPPRRLSREQALAVLAEAIGGVSPWDDFLDQGTLRLFPVAIEDPRFADGFELGNGRGLALVWELMFRREGEVATWRARVDATTGELRELVDVNDYGRVTGGVYVTAPAAGETVRPMPFADVGGGTANSAGLFTTGTGSTLNGTYVRILDSCGAINRPVNGSGNIPFGTSTGTDCAAPAGGGTGNTHSARTTYYHLSRARENGRGWLPGNAWLAGKLTANTDINSTCNAFWSGTTVNFYRSGGGCNNTGELAGVILHEYGHGLDQNDGSGTSADRGTGETYGDFTAALSLRSSCIGTGFYPSGSCSGYGDACTGCSGIRDIDWGRHSSAAPHTVSNFTRTLCPASAGYQGPCGREGHCESYVSSEALWDLAARDLPSPNTNASWSVTERLWYLSRATATKAFNCTTTGSWTSNGCFTGSYWRSMRAVDDDDGNLANGTPHGGALWAAFNRHGIACATDAAATTTFAAVTPPAVPTLTLTAGANKATVAWTSSGAGVVYDVYRSEINCNSGFVKAANDRTGTSWVDTAVAGGSTYYYFVTAHPSGNEAAASIPTTCKSVAPTTPPPPPSPPPIPASLDVQPEFCQGMVTLTWSASTGAAYYELYQAHNSSYTGQVLVYSGTGLSRFLNGTGTRWFRVRACNANGCSGYRNGNRSAPYYDICL